MPFASKKKRLSVTPSTSDLSSLNQEEPVSLLAYKSDVSISQKEVSLNELQPVDLATYTTDADVLSLNIYYSVLRYQ